MFTFMGITCAHSVYTVVILVVLLTAIPQVFSREQLLLPLLPLNLEANPLPLPQLTTKVLKVLYTLHSYTIWQHENKEKQSETNVEDSWDAVTEHCICDGVKENIIRCQWSKQRVSAGFSNTTLGHFLNRAMYILSHSECSKLYCTGWNPNDLSEVVKKHFNPGQCYLLSVFSPWKFARSLSIFIIKVHSEKQGNTVTTSITLNDERAPSGPILTYRCISEWPETI